MLSLLPVLLSNKIWHSKNFPPKGHVFKNGWIAPFKKHSKYWIWVGGGGAEQGHPYHTLPPGLAPPSQNVAPPPWNVPSHLNLFWHVYLIFIKASQILNQVTSRFEPNTFPFWQCNPGRNNVNLTRTPFLHLQNGTRLVPLSWGSWETWDHTCKLFHKVAYNTYSWDTQK